MFVCSHSLCAGTELTAPSEEPKKKTPEVVEPPVEAITQKTAQVNIGITPAEKPAEKLAEKPKQVSRNLSA